MSKKINTNRCVVHEERLRNIDKSLNEIKSLMIKHIETSDKFRQMVTGHETAFKWVWGALVILFGSISTLIYAMLR